MIRHRPLRTTLIIAAGATLAAMFAACGGGGDDNNENNVSVETIEATPGTTVVVPPASATRPRTPSATATASPSASPSPSTTPTAGAGGAPREDAVAAALESLNARYVSPLNLDACLADNPDLQICIELASTDAAVERGVATFRAGDPNGGGFRFYMGRLASGDWGYWFGTQQNAAILADLPGEVLICGAEGEPVTVRSELAAGSAAVGTLETLDSATAEEFVLTSPSEFGRGTTAGTGAYRISAPVEGWVDAADITDAALVDCALHDAIAGTQPHG